MDDAVDEHVRTELVGFVRALRRAGASVPANAATTAARALGTVGLEDRDRVRTALKASLLTDSDDFGTFERLFAEFWRRLAADGEAGRDGLDGDDLDGSLAAFGETPPGEETDARDESGDADDDGASGDPSLADSFGAVVTEDAPDAEDDEAETALYSRSGSASRVEGNAVAATGSLEESFRALTRSLGGLRGRRFEAGSGRTDVRRALRASTSTGGTVVTVPERERRRSAVRAVLFVDVSRSVLDTVDRGFLIDVLRRACREWRDVRVFLFDEDVREVTDAVDADSATAAMEALEAAETAWGGGTRIGDSLARLREEWPEAVDRRAVAFVVSDGLEMGDVRTLETECSRLARRAKRVFWLNPLAASDEYEPTARGMAAAHPYVDGLFAFAGPDDVAELARQLRRQGPGGRIGHEFDARAGKNRRSDRSKREP
jgi:uncharacterized protein with von Willebrand factor type A (vWA) domain